MASKEQVWLSEYLKCFNATEAARRADYKWPNKIGPAKKQKFADEIAAALAEKAIGADEALARLADIANFDPSPYVQRQGRLIGFDVNAMIEDGYGHMIRKVYQTKDGARVEWADPDWALELSLKHQTAGPSGGADDPIHTINYIVENRPDDSDDDSTDD